MSIYISSDHLSNLQPNVDAGLWVLGGASLDEPLKAGEAPKINGSVMLAQADTKEEVLEIIKKDVYATSGVWDESRVSFFLGARIVCGRYICSEGVACGPGLVPTSCCGQKIRALAIRMFTVC